MLLVSNAGVLRWTTDRAARGRS